jgi:hypothetical protein
MVVTEEQLPKEDYCIRMLEKQVLPGVLPLQQRHMDNKTLFYYDITGKQSMLNLYAKASLSYEMLMQLISYILETVELAYEYLIPEDDFILNPEFIYVDVVTNAPSLCFLSGYRRDSKGQMSNLLEYLMNKVDYNDKEAVLMVYRLYAVSKEDGHTFAHLNDVLHKITRVEAAVQGNLSGIEIQARDKSLLNYDKSTVEDLAADHNRINQNRTDQNRIYHNQLDHNESNHHDLNNNRMDRSRINIPVVMERLEEEEEVSYYPKVVYILTVICGLAGVLIIVLGFTTGILYNSFGERIEFGKSIGLLLIVLCVEGYLMRKLWGQDNKLTKIVTKSEYIDPRQEGEDFEVIKNDNTRNTQIDHIVPDHSQLTKREYELWKRTSESSRKDQSTPLSKATLVNEEVDSQEDYNPTCLLSDTTIQSTNTSRILLKSPDEEQYASIGIHEFPFFIGKLRKNVDYCLEKNVVSRYHAKLTKEEDKYYITDLNTTNGTFVNDQILTTYEKKEITQGDRIALANLNFEFITTGTDFFH